MNNTQEFIGCDNDRFSMLLDIHRDIVEDIVKGIITTATDTIARLETLAYSKSLTTRELLLITYKTGSFISKLTG